MLKSPTSILNSIQKMKTNLRNDKQQLRIIKNNFVYLDQPLQSTRQYKQDFKAKTRSKSVLNLDYLNMDYLKQKAQQNKQNISEHSNNASRISQISGKTRNNKMYIDDQAENILKDISSFRKNSNIRQKQEDSKKETMIVKNVNNRHKLQMERMKRSHEMEKTMIVERFSLQRENQKMEYQKVISQMKEYIGMIEEQLDGLDAKEVERIDGSCQVTQRSEIDERQMVEQEVQTDTVHQQAYSNIKITDSISEFCSNPSQSNSNNPFEANSNPFQSSIQTESRINSESSPNQSVPKVNGLNLNQNHLIQQLCLRFFNDNQLFQNQQQNQELSNDERTRYQHIINRLLQENTRLQLKMEKVYGEMHSQHSKEKVGFFRNQGINYKTVTSQPCQDSNFNSSLTGQSKVIQKYFSSKQSLHPHPIPESQPISEFTSRVNDPKNYHSNHSCSNQSKSKQSIIYRVSNVMSTQRFKQCKNSSRSKIPCKNPPIRPQQRQLQLRMKTQVSERSSVVNYEHPNCSFKFYDDESSRSSKSKNAKHKVSKEMEAWEEQSQSEILNDEMKLKTIKTFRCFEKK